ncbi:MAG: hypothetical protein LBD14_06550 [Puniceicoccales bacterium]|nr:hypothetical protein [Puniceicoccales bacterium]
MKKNPDSRLLAKTLFPLSLALAALLHTACATEYSLVEADTPYSRSYAVVVSKATYADPAWRNVADTLVRKHNATLIQHEGTPDNARADLARHLARHTAFVATPDECGRSYIARVHRLTRQLDDDPWLDTQWGVITGATPAAALRLVTESVQPFEIKKALATTHLNETLFDEYFLLSDSPDPAGAWTWKKPDGTVQRGVNNLGKNDALVWAEHLEMSPDLIVTSSHGFENGVEMPLPLRRGIIRVFAGKLYPFADPRQTIPPANATPIAPTPNPKVYFPVGNCLVGHVNAPECMVTTMMSRYGVNQLAGYTVNTWFGRAAWDMLAQWQTLPGRNSFSESFFFNQQHLLHDIAAIDPNALAYNPRLGPGPVELRGHLLDMVAAKLKFDPRRIRNRGKDPDYQLAGLLWDRDTLAFYGDPAWRATLNHEKEPRFLRTHLHSRGDTHTLTLTIANAPAAAQNTTPIGIPLTTRIKNIKLLEGHAHAPIIADNFILILKPQPQPNQETITLKFTADPIQPPSN